MERWINVSGFFTNTMLPAVLAQHAEEQTWHTTLRFSYRQDIWT
jgi:hypothetical protein